MDWGSIALVAAFAGIVGHQIGRSSGLHDGREEGRKAARQERERYGS